MECNLKIVSQWKIIKFGSGILVLYSDYSTPIQINYFSFTGNNISWNYLCLTPSDVFTGKYIRNEGEIINVGWLENCSDHWGRNKTRYECTTTCQLVDLVGSVCSVEVLAKIYWERR